MVKLAFIAKLHTHCKITITIPIEEVCLAAWEALLGFGNRKQLTQNSL